MLSCTRATQVHDTILAINLSLLSERALLTHQITVNEFLSVQLGEHVEIWKIVSQGTLDSPARTDWTLHLIPTAISKGILQAGPTHTVKARQHSDLMPTINLPSVRKALLAICTLHIACQESAFIHRNVQVEVIRHLKSAIRGSWRRGLTGRRRLLFFRAFLKGAGGRQRYLLLSSSIFLHFRLSSWLRGFRVRRRGYSL
mmetsp:Transcript_29389/g.51506  ORF Transcript_29389/g.51506 Transcript_29389/m.51506 type:complete len:200 (+) Transcript_29389:980-1579(+)